MTERARDSIAKPDFRGDGFVVLPELLAAKDIESVRVAVDRVMKAPQASSCARPNNTLVPLRWGDPIIAHMFEAPSFPERLGTAVAARDLRWISGYISAKSPHSLPLWWHQDWWCWDHPITRQPEPVQIALLSYLTDTDSRRDALRVLPGSHAHSTPLQASRKHTTAPPPPTTQRTSRCATTPNRSPSTSKPATPSPSTTGSCTPHSPTLAHTDATASCCLSRHAGATYLRTSAATSSATPPYRPRTRRLQRPDRWRGSYPATTGRDAT